MRCHQYGLLMIIKKALLFFVRWSFLLHAVSRSAHARKNPPQPSHGLGLFRCGLRSSSVGNGPTTSPRPVPRHLMVRRGLSHDAPRRSCAVCGTATPCFRGAQTQADADLQDGGRRAQVSRRVSKPRGSNGQTFTGLALGFARSQFWGLEKHYCRH